MFLFSFFIRLSGSESRLDTGDLTRRVLCGPVLEAEGLSRRTEGMLGTGAAETLGRRGGFITDGLFKEQAGAAAWIFL